MKICLQAGAVKQIENYFSISTDGVEIRIWFLTDSVVRIRAGFDGDFVEESYSLVTTAWEDRMDMFMKHYRKRIQTAEAQLTDGLEKAVIQGKVLRVEVEMLKWKISKMNSNCLPSDYGKCFQALRMALGSSMYYPELEKDCDDAILEFIDTTKEEEIPVDGFQLSSGYCAIETEEGIKRCVFTWNKKRFKDPKDFFKQMKDRGICVSPNVKPGILLLHPKKEEMQAKGMFVRASRSEEPGIGTWWGGKGVFVDFTKQETRDNWKAMLKENVLEYGTSSVWNDNCEYDSMIDKDCRCDFEGKGATIGQLKSVMSNIMCHITDEAVHEIFENQRPYIVCRSGHCGIQKYAQTWAGDNLTCWEALKYNIATILGMGLSGVANQGCDIGGFYGPAPEAELLVRWIQNGIFQPRFSIHSTNTDNTVTEPWMYSGCKEYIKKAIEFRYQLIPYLYSLMERAHETGLPIMEPLCSAFQNDEKCYDEGVDFMFGDALLVANVVEKGAKTRKVYLPDGEVFYDFYTRARYEGGQTIEFPVDLSSIPLFVRSGAIVPMALNQMNNLMTQEATGLKILCAPDKDSSLVIYEDDGETMDYANGGYLKTVLDIKAGEQTVLSFRNEGEYETADEDIYLDVIHREKAPYWVEHRIESI